MSRVETIGDCALYLGDCLEILPTLGKVDAVVTDPPYGLSGASTEKNSYESYSDDATETESLVKKALELSKASRVVMTPGQKLMFKYQEPSAIGAFYYPAGTGSCSWGFVGWLPIFYDGKDPVLADGRGRAANSFESTEQAEKNGHPCPKPIIAWQKLVARVSRKGETILDPFMGSGTTGVACVKLGRKFIGIEIEPKYFDIAVRRIEKAVSEPRLALPEPKMKQDKFAL